MPTAKEILARTRAKMMKTVDVSGARQDRGRDSRPDEASARSASQDQNSDGSESEAGEQSPTTDETGRKKWTWKNAFRKKNRVAATDDSEEDEEPQQQQQQQQQRGRDNEEENDDDVVDDLMVEAYTQEYDNANESNFRVPQRNNWQAKVAENKYWKKLLRPPLRDAEKKERPEKWDDGLQSLGDVPVSSKYVRGEAARNDESAARHQRRNERTSAEDVEVDVEPDGADYKSSSSDDRDDRGYDHGKNVDVDDGVDVEEFTNTITTEERDDDNGNNRQHRNLRYFADDEEDVHTASYFARASRHNSQHSNSSAASIGATGLPANVQPFRWVPYYGGANGFGHNPFSPYGQRRYSPQPGQGPSMQGYEQPLGGYDDMHTKAPTTPSVAGADDYDMGLRYSTTPGIPGGGVSREVKLDRETPYRPGSVPWADYNLPSVSPTYDYATSYSSPSPGNGRASVATPASSDGRASTAVTPSLYGANAGSMMMMKMDGSGRHDAHDDDVDESETRRVVAEGRRRHEAQMAAGQFDVLGIGAAAPATPSFTPAMGSFYGPIGTLGIEASEKRQKLETSTGTVGHTVRAYQLAAAYPDLANLCGDGVLMMTRMWCDPAMLTGAQRVTTPELPELKEEDGAIKMGFSGTTARTVSSYGLAPTATAGSLRKPRHDTTNSAAAKKATTASGANTPSVKTSTDRKRASVARTSHTAAGTPQRPPSAAEAGGSRAPSRGGGGLYVEGKNTVHSNSTSRSLSGAPFSRPGSMHSVMGGSVYSQGAGANMESSMLGPDAINDFISDFAGMDGSYVEDDDADRGNEAGEEGSSGNDSDSDTSTSSASTSDDDDDAALGTPLANKSGDHAGKKASVPEGVNEYSLSGGKNWQSRPSLTMPSTSVRPKSASSPLAAAAAAAAAAAGGGGGGSNASGKPSQAVSRRTSTVSPGKSTSISAGKARSGSVTTDLAYAYAPDVSSFDAYMSPMEGTPLADPALLPGTDVVTPTPVKSASKPAVGAATAPVKSAPAAAVTAKKASSPPPSASHVRRSITAPLPSSTVPPIVAPVPPPGEPTRHAVRVTEAHTSDNVDDVALKRRNSKFLSNDLSGSGHDRATKLAPLAPTTTTTTTTGPKAPATASTAPATAPAAKEVGLPRQRSALPITAGLQLPASTKPTPTPTPTPKPTPKPTPTPTPAAAASAPPSLTAATKPSTVSVTAPAPQSAPGSAAGMSGAAPMRRVTKPGRVAASNAVNGQSTPLESTAPAPTTVSVSAARK